MKSQRILALFPFILVFYEITNYLANDMYLPALPLIASDLNIGLEQVGLTLTTWFLGTASLQLILGPLSDRVGRRPVLLGGGIIFIISTLLCALTTNIHVLLVARFFQGCSVCSVVTAGYSSVHELYETNRAIKFLAIMGSITVLAPAFGPFFGALILQWLDWRWIFGLLFIWGAIALTLLWMWMPESTNKETRHPLEWKTLLANYKAILMNPTFMYNTLIFCLTFLGMIAWITLGPFLVIEVFKYNSLMFGVFQVLVFGCLILGAQFVKYTVDKLGVHCLINAGLWLTFIGSVVGVIFTFFFPHWLWGVIIALMIFTFGSSLAFGPSHRLAIEACQAPMGARMAIFSSLMGIFGVIGSLLVSLTYTGSIRWLTSLLIILAVLAAMLRWIERKKSVCLH